MKPVSPFTYYRRHARQAAVLAGLIGLATFGICSMVALFDSMLQNGPTFNSYLTYIAQVDPEIGNVLDANTVAQIRTHPDVAQVIPVRRLYMVAQVSFIRGPFNLFGVSEADMTRLMDVCKVRLKEGRLPRARTNEFVISEAMARTLGLHLGSAIGRSIDRDTFGSLPTDFVLVGILESTLPPERSKAERTIRVGFTSFEYLDSHENYRESAVGLLIVPQEGRKAAVDDFLETTVASVRTGVTSAQTMAEFTSRTRLFVYLIFGIVDVLVAGVVAFVVGAINQIALSQRLEEFGLLQALGYAGSCLIRGVVMETAVIAGISWLVGVVLAWLTLGWLETNVYAPRGLFFDLTNLLPAVLAIPIPVVVVAFAAFSAWRVLSRLDAVAIVERGKLSLEASEPRRANTRSLNNPVSSRTFYVRHRRRAHLLVAAMTLMILGVAFPVFLLTPMIESGRYLRGFLGQFSEVSPVGDRQVVPGVTAQIKNHPAVSKVVPAMQLWVSVAIPPLSQTSASIYAVSEEDLQVLLDLYGVSLTEGRLPRARTNEIVLSEAIVKNRGLHLGDKIGRPVFEDDGSPMEMQVVGILASDNLWLGFASLEYLQAHALTSKNAIGLLVVASEGRKAEMDAWLQQTVASAQTNVETYEETMHQLQESTQSIVLLFAAVEAIIALVAAIAMAILNAIFFSQRKEEVGTLFALGYSRLRLILRAIKEIGVLTLVAWLCGALICLAAALYAQASLYSPKGIQLDVFDPAPWSFTIPIPLAVVVASAGTVAWALSRLDPVAIIERR